MFRQEKRELKKLEAEISKITMDMALIDSQIEKLEKEKKKLKGQMDD